MSALRHSLVVSTPPRLVARYLSDLATSVEWDPHTTACRPLDDRTPGPGVRYAHTRTFLSYEVTLEAEVVAFEPGALVAWTAGNELATGREEFRFRPADGGGTEVEHSVEVTLRGVARFGQRMVPGIMQRIADDGTETLRARLEQLV